MSLLALAMTVLLQETATVEVVERIELSAEQQQAVSVLSQAGMMAGYCAAHLPPETRAAFDRGAAALTDMSAPGGALPDVAFLGGYARAAAGPGWPSAERCADAVTDGRLLIEGQRQAVESLIALTAPLETRRPWTLIGQAAVDAGAQPRRRAGLNPGSAREAGAVRTAPQWAQAPRVAVPRQARAARRAGTATIECIVTAEGRARDCRVIGESEAGYGFGQAAIEAQEVYRFHPSTIDGQPVESRGVFTVRFRL